MKKKKHSGVLDRQIMMAAIASTDFLRQYATIYKPEYIVGEMMKTVMAWCVEYYSTEKEAPGLNIKTIYAKNKELESVDPDVIDDIGDFLRGLKKEIKNHKEVNVGYLVKHAEAALNLESLRRTKDQLEKAIEEKDTDEGFNLLRGTKPVSIVQVKGVNPLLDEEVIERSFAEQADPLFQFPGRFGKMINSSLCRESFIIFLGREKVGKTWRLIDFARRALRFRRSVAFFQVGDLSEEQQTMRFNIAAAGRSNRSRYCGKIRVPVLDCWNNQDDSCEKKQRKGEFGIIKDVKEIGFYTYPIYESWEECEGYEPCTYCLKKGLPGFTGSTWWKEKEVSPLTPHEAIRIGKKQDKVGAAKLKLACAPTGTATCSWMNDQLDQWEEEDGFIPDVILSDYMDIMRAENDKKEFRHQRNDICIGLRRLSQERKACLITASQADAASYKQFLLNMGNFSDDKRINAHVTAMFGLNQNNADKARGIMRINPIVLREDEFNSSHFVSVLQHLGTGRPHLGSF